MCEHATYDPAEHPDLGWYENGQSVLGGPLLELSRRLDSLFVRWSEECGAEEVRYPTFIPAEALHKLDYFHSFPHLATFPVTLDSDESNLKAFADGKPMTKSGAVRLTETAPVKDVLTPAACFHVYVGLRGQALSKPRFLTTVATCFRREVEYLPLQRQWSFHMREIVCVGAEDEVRGFLERYRERVGGFIDKTKLPVQWEVATDPFFSPARNPKYLMQKIQPVKTEMVFEERLAIGSINFHRNFFGEAFDITRNGAHAFSGCVAFGLERWLYAFLKVYGPDPRNWPGEEFWA